MAYTNIDDPSAYFQTATYAGNGGTLAVVNDGNSDLQPDWVWCKRRDVSANHVLYDSSRGASKVLYSNLTDGEETVSGVTAFNTDGFTLGSDGNANASSGSHVAWQWKANGGTTSTNTDGDINSTVQVNADAGFSIVLYNPSNTTTRNIGHGLGVKPDCILIRNRTRIENWRMWFNVIGQGALTLDGTAAYTVNSNLVNSATTSTFNVGGDFSVNGNYPYVAYCFAEKQGYSKFGKYVGNGSADGTFVYTGFRPAMIILKRTDAANNWLIYDHKRSGYNPKQDKLYPDDSSAEDASTTSVDLLSNGFKLRASSASQNASGGTYIYMAFAENPFTTSTGIPTTAR